MSGTVTVTLPAALLPLFPGAPRQLAVEAATVDEVMDALEARWPGMRRNAGSSFWQQRGA